MLAAEPVGVMIQGLLSLGPRPVGCLGLGSGARTPGLRCPLLDLPGLRNPAMS